MYWLLFIFLRSLFSGWVIIVFFLLLFTLLKFLLPFIVIAFFILFLYCLMEEKQKKLTLKEELVQDWNKNRGELISCWCLTITAIVFFFILLNSATV
jgi:hypothetical protein